MWTNRKQKWLFIPVLCLFTSWPFLRMDQGEQVSLSLKERADLLHPSYGLFYKKVPAQPRTTQDLVTFKDQALTQVAASLKENQNVSLIKLVYRADGTPLFQLKDGSYLLASRRFVFSNQLLWKEDYKGEAWLEPNASFYKEVPDALSKASETDYKAYAKVPLKQIRIYPRGTFGITDKGEYISLPSVVNQDNRMERVQQLLKEKYQQDGLGIYVKQLETGQTAGINQTKKMYSASITKLPYLYYIQKQVLEGKLKWTDTFRYTKETEDYDGAYDPAGTGSLPKEPDDKDYSVKELEEKAAKESDNVAHNILGYYGTKSSNRVFREEIRQVAGESWDVVEREVSPEMAAHLMEAIYNQGGDLLEMLKKTEFDSQRIPRDLPVPVAHKIGDADDFHHDASVVFTDSPYVLVVFTEKKDNELISKISKDIYEVLK